MFAFGLGALTAATMLWGSFSPAQRSRQRAGVAGCVSQGDTRTDTRAEALNNIRETIELYVEDCRDAGDPVPNVAGKEFVEVDAA